MDLQLRAGGGTCVARLGVVASRLWVLILGKALALPGWLLASAAGCGFGALALLIGGAVASRMRWAVIVSWSLRYGVGEMELRKGG